ncbi:MAG TPA: non-homologous end-joining DNA ligase [Fimbriimonadaceae bacterium]|nr:non-homologous end-joining DNA ligase [Fimbriimonadaceae bacterium]HRJ97419.1 non-homologous end-joining DNA ligase [Fimbriimonadaceae bacterium]
MADALDPYRAKRDARATPEPEATRAPERSGPLLFCVQKHAATQLHYDLRLELDGVLKSWAIPKGPSYSVADKRYAAHVEDHPLEYVAFEGNIPKQEYGGGEMLLWDTGFYTPDEGGVYAFDDRAVAQNRLRAEMEAGKIAFSLLGTKLKGSWTLVRTKDGWLLIKHTDRFAGDRDVLLEHCSVVTGRTIEEIGQEKAAHRTPWPPRGDRATYPAPFRPMLCSSVQHAFDDPDWLFEPKLDGVRVLAFVQNGKARLYTRNLNEVTVSFPEVVSRLESQIPRNAVFDGEIVGFDAEGRPGFHMIQQRIHLRNELEVQGITGRVPVVFFAFDVLHLEGLDLRGAPLDQRRLILSQVLVPDPGLQIVHQVASAGKALYEVAVKTGFEGVVGKQRDSTYEAGRRSKAWRKVRSFTADEFVVCGYTISGSDRRDFGALILGKPNEGGYRYVGNVGSGFDDATLRDFRTRLDEMVQPECPFPKVPDTIDPPVWVRPEWVVEVKYAEITPTGLLRSPVFLRLREDEGPQDLVSIKEADTLPILESDLLPDILDQLENRKSNLTLTIQGDKVDLTNLDKIYWPVSEEGPAITKRDLIRYYARIGHAMIPHLADRPFTMIRFPEGIRGEKFFQKHWAQPKPDYADVVWLFSESNRENQRYIVCNNLPTLCWLGQLATLECHVWHSRTNPEPDHPDHPLMFADSEANIDASLLNFPDYLTFDMDPYTYAGHEKAGDEPELNQKAFQQARMVAGGLRELLESLGLRPFVKTSGKTGLHVFVPIIRNIDFDAVRRLSGAICTFLVQRYPEDATTEWQIERRTGKVFLDYTMNVRGKTLAAAFSPRAHPGGPISMPIRWEELDRIYPTDFTIWTGPDRISAIGDAWADIDRHKADLRGAIERMS